MRAKGFEAHLLLKLERQNCMGVEEAGGITHTHTVTTVRNVWEHEHV